MSDAANAYLSSSRRAAPRCAVALPCRSNPNITRPTRFVNPRLRASCFFLSFFLFHLPVPEEPSESQRRESAPASVSDTRLPKEPASDSSISKTVSKKGCPQVCKFSTGLAWADSRLPKEPAAAGYHTHFLAVSCALDRGAN